MDNKSEIYIIALCSNSTIWKAKKCNTKQWQTFFRNMLLPAISEINLIDLAKLIGNFDYYDKKSKEFVFKSFAT